ncbi:MAG: extracellular solute-binding protein [Chloroflexota bacterium]
MKRIRSFVFILAAMSLIGGFGIASAQDKPFDGVTVRVLSFVGPAVTEPILRRQADFEALTGAHLEITTVPNADLFTDIVKDQSTGTDSYDVFIAAPQWKADLVSAGYLEDLTPYVEKDKAIQWDDITPFFRNFIATYDGKIYNIPLDGDINTIYYRTDVFADAKMEPPKTWEEYLTAAAAFNGKDLNGDGEADYGSCIPKVRAGQGYWWVLNVAAPYIQSQGTAQGMFFNTDDMTPLVNNEGFIRALQIYNETTQYGPPNELTLSLNDTRDLFLTGRCAMSIDWGDTGTLSIDPTRSQMKDKIAALINPGSTEVVDRATGKLVPCDATTCPFAVDGVNYAPLAAWGGWGGAISAASDQKVKDAGYALLSYMSEPDHSNEDVTIGASGYNPYRTSQFASLDLWVKAGFSEAGAQNYIGAIKDSVSSPNMVLDLAIPGVQRYQQVVLDTVVSQFLAGEFTAEEAAQQLYDQSEEITNELGRDTQKAAYLASLGVSTK